MDEEFIIRNFLRKTFKSVTQD